ncbi:MAG: alpha/beta fold hydrolase [Verrucomicrobia bacterium]|nr:alpha/beta fold hydrolase [Verrucomicrobiota bacterium]
MKISVGLAFVLLLATAGHPRAADYPKAHAGDVVLRDFTFRSGESLPELRIHYNVLGRPRRDAQGVVRNAVLVMHGTGGAGKGLLRPEFAGELFGAGQPLDATKFFIILPDAIGHGQSTRPSDGLRAKFPRYGYRDIVAALHRALTESLGVNHLRLVMGTSQGGMLTWLWGEEHPEFMDALLPLASLPTQIAGRNRAWRRVAIDAVRGDPAWQQGNYAVQPPSLRTVAGMFFLVGSNPVLRHEAAPTLGKADEVLDAYAADFVAKNDTNDILYAVEASHDYDPGPALEKIRAPLLAINSADDYINPPELGLLEREIKRVPRGRAVILPLAPDTRGHQSHTFAKLWKHELGRLLAESEP